MGDSIERKAVELIEAIRKRTKPRVSQEKLGEHIWPRRYDEEGNETGDPQKSYSLLINPAKNREPRRLKLGEFINACQFLNFDPQEVLTLAKLAAERGIEVDMLLGESTKETRASPSQKASQKRASWTGSGSKETSHGSR